MLKNAKLSLIFRPQFVLIPVSESYAQQKLLKPTLKLFHLSFIAINCVFITIHGYLSF